MFVRLMRCQANTPFHEPMFSPTAVGLFAHGRVPEETLVKGRWLAAMLCQREVQHGNAIPDCRLTS